MTEPPSYQDCLENYSKVKYFALELNGMPDIGIFIGQNSPHLDEFLRSQNANSAILITGHNPRSVIMNPAFNDEANRKLELRLKQRNFKHFHSPGADSNDCKWPREPGFLVLDIPKDDTQELLELFGQNAAVSYEIGQKAELLFERNAFQT